MVSETEEFIYLHQKAYPFDYPPVTISEQYTYHLSKSRIGSLAKL